MPSVSQRSSRIHLLRRALIGGAVFLLVIVALTYQLVLDRFHARITPPPFQVAEAAAAPTLYIPSLGKSVPIVYSKSRDDAAVQADLDKGVSLDVQSPRPGQAGNVFLTGHSNNWPWHGQYRSIFGNLDQLKAGDEIILDADKRYTYRVTGQRVVNPTDVSVMDSDPSKHQLTLMTCWPPSTTWNRRIVTAELAR
jgi:LPXTG-site transpeptidase (sortase) family protein